VSIRHVPADGLNLAAVLRAWRKDAKVLTIRVPHDKIEAVKDAVVAAGGTVL
jgi:predicted DNA binding CopG/RHH family protein